MSLIEQATKRLQELEKAGIRAEPTLAKAEARPSADPVTPHPLRAAANRTSPLPAPSTDAANYRHIDFGRLQANGFITPNIPDSKLMHEFRVIKRPLIQNALGRTAGPVANGNLIMVTS